MNKFNCLWTNLVVVVVVYFFNLFFSCSDWITIWWTSGSFREWVPEENLWAEILHCKYNSSAQVPRIVVQCSCGMAHQKYQDGSFKPLKVQITLFSRAKETIISHFCTSLFWNYHNKKKPLALTVSCTKCDAFLPGWSWSYWMWTSEELCHDGSLFSRARPTFCHWHGHHWEVKSQPTVSLPTWRCAGL